MKVYYVWPPPRRRRKAPWLARPVWFLGVIWPTLFLALLAINWLVVTIAGWGVESPVFARGWVVDLLLSMFLALYVAYLALQRFRGRRLAGIARHPDAIRRLPHRVWESKRYKSNNSGDNPYRVLVQLPRGTVLVNSAPRGRTRPQPTDIPFEPAHVRKDPELLRALEAIGEARSTQRDDTEALARLESAGSRNWRPEPHTVVGQAGRFANQWLIRLSIPMYGLMVAVVGMAAWFKGEWRGWVIVAMMTFPIWILATASVTQASWWLAPGTLIYRRSRPWWRHDRVGWARADESVLLIDCDRHIGSVVIGDRAHGFAYHADADWAILAGWLSTARRPTPEEIMSFLGPDVEVDARMTPTTVTEKAAP